MNDNSIVNHYHFLILFLVFFTAGCSSPVELKAGTTAQATQKFQPIVMTEVARRLLLTQSPSQTAFQSSECGQLPPLQVITKDNSPELRFLCTLHIPDYQTASVSQCSLSFSPDGSLLAGVCGVNPAPVWDVQSGELLEKLLGEASHQVAIAFSPDGDFVVVGGFSGEVTFFESSSGEPSGVVLALPSPVWDLDFSPSSASLAIATFEDGVFMQTLPANEPAQEVGDRGQKGTLSVDIAPDGETLAYGTLLNGVWVVEVETGNILAHLNVPAPVGDLAFSPDGKWLATGSDDNLIRIWKTGDYALAQTMTGHKAFVNGVAFTPDSLLVAAGSKDKTVTVWDVATGSLLTKLEEHTRDVLRLEVNPQGKLIASISWDGSINLWGVVEP